MASNPIVSGSDPVQKLGRHQALLQQRHEEIKREDQAIRQNSAKECEILLQKSVKELCDVIKLVHKLDSRLVHWHSCRPGIKKALRLIGVDRRTETTIQKNTEKLKGKIEEVGNQFDQTSDAFDSRLRDTKRIGSTFTTLATHGVEQVSREATLAIETYQEDLKSIDAEHRKKAAVYEDIEVVLDGLQSELKKTETNQLFAQMCGGAWVLGSAVVATASFTIFPPAAIAVGYIGAKKAISWQTEVSDLQQHKGEFSKRIEMTDAFAAQAKAELDYTCLNKIACEKGKTEAEKIQWASLEIRRETQQYLQVLRNVEIELHVAREKLGAISRELGECQYEKTRRDISKRFKDILRTILGLPQKASLRKIDDKLISQVTHDLDAIEKNTKQVLKIAAKAESSE
ncbi:hypothetical protein HD806DRAFT_488908 [Xylariaceae sp. AK1471]|nr:hypothetical protein HD806DRAFT_488908 [Xylariaceae sp. AK1471]